MLSTRIFAAAIVALLVATSTAQEQPPSAISHPALFLVGDSIMATGSPTGEVGPRGWGSEILPLFDPAKIHVYNEGRGGRSSRSYIAEGLWSKILDQLQPGDFVIVGFGHNDSANSRNYPDRISVKGSGDETQEIDSPSGEKETIHSYGWYLRQYAVDAKSKGATLIILSPPPRNDWSDGKIKRGFDGYAQWAADAAHISSAPFIDLNSLSADQFDTLGQEAAAKYFADHQHTTKLGAKLNAQSVVTGIQQLKDSSLAADLLTANPAPAAETSTQKTSTQQNPAQESPVQKSTPDNETKSASGPDPNEIPIPPIKTALGTLPGISELPDRPELPDVLTMNDGAKVTTLDQWHKRREEMKHILEYYAVGLAPPPPDNVKGQEIKSQLLLDGKVKYRLVHLTFGPQESLSLDIGIFTPTTGRPFPAIISPSGTPPGATPLPRLAQGPGQGKGVDALLAVGPAPKSDEPAASPAARARRIRRSCRSRNHRLPQSSRSPTASPSLCSTTTIAAKTPRSATQMAVGLSAPRVSTRPIPITIGASSVAGPGASRASSIIWKPIPISTAKNSSSPASLAPANPP